MRNPDNRGSNLYYPDSLGPHEIVRIIEGPDNRDMSINEGQKSSKTDSIKKTTFNRKKTISQIIWNTVASASSFLSFMERKDRLSFKR